MNKPLLLKYRTSLCIFIIGLTLSGLTAFPLLWELETLSKLLKIEDPQNYKNLNGLYHWVGYVTYGLRDTYQKYPFIAYGTDWLGFGHIIIALFFIKPLLEPKGHSWVLKCGLIACIGVIPLALIMGEIRQIPIYWRLIDIMFGVLGAIPLLYCLKIEKQLRDETG